MRLLKTFIADLKTAGIPIGLTEETDCYQSLLLIDWTNEPIFYSALRCTLLKETALLSIFNQIYKQHFNSAQAALIKSDDITDSSIASLQLVGMSGISQGVSMFSPQRDHREAPLPLPFAQPALKSKNPLTRNFYEATYMGTPEELASMEQLIPLLGKRMAAKMVIKKKRYGPGTIDLRKTLRMSLNSGGVPVDLSINKKQKEKQFFKILNRGWGPPNSTAVCLYLRGVQE